MLLLLLILLVSTIYYLLWLILLFTIIVWLLLQSFTIHKGIPYGVSWIHWSSIRIICLIILRAIIDNYDLLTILDAPMDGCPGSLGERNRLGTLIVRITCWNETRQNAADSYRFALPGSRADYSVQFISPYTFRFTSRSGWEEAGVHPEAWASCWNTQWSHGHVAGL